MTDLRVDTKSIKNAYMARSEPWSVMPTWRLNSSRTMTTKEMDAGTGRIVGVLKRFFEARMMAEHREVPKALDRVQSSLHCMQITTFLSWVA
jgi:hypothetical protein